MGEVDARHLSIGVAAKTAEILRSDGTIHDGPRDDYKTAGSKTLELKWFDSLSFFELNWIFLCNEQR